MTRYALGSFSEKGFWWSVCADAHKMAEHSPVLASVG